MPGTEADGRTTSGAPPRGGGADLTRAQKRSIKACLPFPFRDSESGWAWLSEHASLLATVSAGDEKNTVVVAVLDADSGERIELWTTVLRITGAWRRRLRQCAGEAMILAQARPRCPKCGKPMRLRRAHEERNQFFGCSQYPRCTGLLNIIECDVEHV